MKFLCKPCKKSYDNLTKGQIISESKDINRAVRLADVISKEHDQEFTFYCNTCTCKRLICLTCALKSNRSQRLISVEQAAEREREKVQEEAFYINAKATDILQLITLVKDEMIPKVKKMTGKRVKMGSIGFQRN